MDIVRAAIREPAVADARHFARRVWYLAAAYVGLFGGALAGLVLLFWRGRFLVTLTQRSNVETLLLAFFVVFFLYIVLLSASGFMGALRIGWYALRAAITRDPLAVERAKIRSLGRATGRGPSVSLNYALERSDRPGAPFELAVRDAAGEVGRLRVVRERISLAGASLDGSNNLFTFVVHQIAELLGLPEDELEVLHWSRIDDEAHAEYHSLVAAIATLGERVGCRAWPTLTLTPAQCAELERRLAAVCPAVRSEGFLPHWEYQGEHKLPVVPEPLALISLKRSERRVDPLSSMVGAVAVVALVLALIVFVVVRPPWVPGS